MQGTHQMTPMIDNMENMDGGHMLATPQTKHKMEGRLLLDVVIRKGPTILKLLSSENQPLLVWWDALLILDLGLDVVYGVGALNFKSNGLACEGLHEDLHLSTNTKSN